MITKQSPAGRQLLILSGVVGDTRRYRCFHLYEQLHLAGLPVTLSHQMDSGLLKKAAQADVIFIHRAAFDSRLAQLFELVHKKGGLIFQDVDDLVFDSQAIEWIDSPDFQDPIRAALYREDLRLNRKTLENSSAVSASTEYLAERVRKLGKPVWVHRNGFSLEMLAISKKASLCSKTEKANRPGEKVVIGYASGTPTHNKDFAQISPVLRDVMMRYPQVDLHLVGPLDIGKEWNSLKTRVRHVPLVPWRELPFLLAEFDINLAPLVANNPFSQSKSEIKYMEAAMIRVPTLASFTDAFAFAIQHGENGLLASSEAEWLEALSALIENPADRIAIGDRAYADVQKRYHPAKRAIELLNSLNDIVMSLHSMPFLESQISEDELRGCASRFYWTSVKYERRPTIVEMSWYNLRQRGIRTLAGRVWVFFRRLLLPLFPFKSS